MDNLLGLLISIAGSLGFGAGLMYLLDPERGERRREQLGGQLNETLSKTGKSLEDHVQEMTHRVRELEHEQMRQLNRRWDHLRPQPHHEDNTWLALLGGIGLGVVLTYLLDPKHGGERRQLLVTGVTHPADTAQDIAHTAQEIAHHAEQRIENIISHDAALLNSIKDKLKEVGAELEHLKITVEDGKVVIHGALPAGKRYQITKMLEEVPNVKSVETLVGTDDESANFEGTGSYTA